VAASVRYEVEGWGVGELWLDGETLLWHELPSATATEGCDEPSNELAARLRSYFTGARDSFADVRIDLEGYTAFQRAVVETLRNVPWGEVVSYGELASLAGFPGAARAAGTFCGRCALSPFVPTHRVVGSNGIGSYGDLGVDYKRRLLALEGVSL